MSGDLMHKGITELTEVTAELVTENDYIPLYQKRTLSVNKIKVSELITALIKLSGVELLDPKEVDALTQIEETEAPAEEIRKPSKKGSKSKKAESK